MNNGTQGYLSKIKTEFGHIGMKKQELHSHICKLNF